MSDVEGSDDQTYVAQYTGLLGLWNPVVNQGNLLVVARSNIITPWLVVAMKFIGSGMEAASSSFVLHSIVIICFFCGVNILSLFFDNLSINHKRPHRRYCHY